MFAIDDLSDAIDVTREFLTPVRPWMWLKLALIVFFVGGTGFGGSSFSGGGFGGGGTPSDTGTDPVTSVDFAEWLPILIAIGAILLVIGLGFLFVSSLFEFTLLESLRSGEVHVRRYTSRNVGRGARLFGFRVALGLIALLLLGVPLIAIVLSGIAWGLIVLFILFAIPVVLGLAIVDRFTTVFVAPTMLDRDLGVLAAWKRFWPTLTGNWTEYVVYLLLVWVLQLVIGFATTILLIVVLIPFLILFFILLFIPFLNLLILVLLVPLLLLISALIQVPVVTYLRYYALLVLGDTDSELDLIPEQRAAVRDGGSDRTGGTGGGWDSDDDGPDGDDRGWGDESDPWGRDESQDDGWNDTDDTDSRDDTGWDDTDSSESDDDHDDRRGW